MNELLKTFLLSNIQYVLLNVVSQPCICEYDYYVLSTIEISIWRKQYQVLLTSQSFEYFYCNVTTSRHFAQLNLTLPF